MKYLLGIGLYMQHIQNVTLGCGLIALLLGCGGNGKFVDGEHYQYRTSLPHNVMLEYVDKRLEVMFQQFNLDCKEPVNQVRSIRVAELDGNVLGRCYWGSGSNDIVIDADVMNQPAIVQYAVMYHELGHCQLNLDHSGDEKSIMFPMLNVYDVASIQNTWEYKVNSICGEQ